MSRRTRNLIVASILAAVVLTVVAGWAGYVRFVRGVPLIDEWQCSDGEVPVSYADGGSVCIAEGADPPAGATLDPLGNRPLSCDDRWGWRVVTNGEDEDCLRDGRAVPVGWRVR